MTEIALKPCPFCGKPAAMCQLEDEPGSPASFWVNCSCGVETPERRTEAEAIALWNTRAPAQVEPAAALRDYAQKFSRIESTWEDVRIRHNMHKDYPELARAIELLLMKP